MVGMADERRILVTGAGGAAGIAVINELKRMGIATVGCDINPYAAGIRLADHGTLITRYSDPGYQDDLLAIAQRFEVNGVISTMTEELAVLGTPEFGSVLDDAGLAHWFPPARTATICMDKRQFADTVEAAGQPVPLTGTGDVETALSKVPGPWILKPTFGRGSRDVYAVDSEDEVRKLWAQVPEPILQTRLSGEEFTIDTLVDKDGTLLGGVPRFRVETKAGISTVGRTFEASGLMQLAESLLKSIGHQGPANVQGFIDPNNGDFGFIEVNPRFSGALPLSLASGADLVGQFVAGMYGEQPDASALAYTPGTVMVRYFNEVFFTEDIQPIGPLNPVTWTG